MEGSGLDAKRRRDRILLLTAALAMPVLFIFGLLVFPNTPGASKAMVSLGAGVAIWLHGISTREA
jgi:hypothetical protein